MRAGARWPVVVFLGVVAVDVRPLDPPSTLVWSAEPDRFTTPAAAPARITAHYLFESLGFGAYYLARLARRAHGAACSCAARSISRCSARSAGSMSLVGLDDARRAGGARIGRPGRWSAPAATSARWAAALLETHFAKAGAFIFALSVLAAGLLLSTDYFLFRAAAVTTSVSGRSLAAVGPLRPRRRETKASRVKTDLEDDGEIAASERGRRRRRRTTTSARSASARRRQGRRSGSRRGRRRSRRRGRASRRSGRADEAAKPPTRPLTRPAPAPSLPTA